MEKLIRYSQALSNKQITTECIREVDVLKIWNAMAYYIKEEMCKKRGVVVPGFGVFTFVNWTLDIGNKKQVVTLKPAFILSDKFSKKHNISYEKEYVNETIPVGRINYVRVAEILDRKYSRDIVEIVLNEAFMAIDHFLRCDGHVCASLHQLGDLKIQDMPVKTKKVATFEFAKCMFKENLPSRC